MTPQFRTSRSCQWNEPRPHTDESQRFAKFGKVQPMDTRPIWPAIWWLASRSAVVGLAVGVVVLAIVAFGGN